MGHLDGRMTQEDVPTETVAGNVKDGPTGQKTEQAPHVDDAAEAGLDKASDVLHGGDRKGEEPAGKA